jgi:hypothetical protein
MARFFDFAARAGRSASSLTRADLGLDGADAE